MLPSEQPRTSTARLRIDAACFASPLACSSITRAIRMAANVTPAALMTCRSHGAKKTALHSAHCLLVGNCFGTAFRQFLCSGLWLPAPVRRDLSNRVIRSWWVSRWTGRRCHQRAKPRCQGRQAGLLFEKVSRRGLPACQSSHLQGANASSSSGFTGVSGPLPLRKTDQVVGRKISHSKTG